MTNLEVYENVLSELNKEEAPSLLLQDFVYFANKAIYQKINRDYNFYGMNQQISDSLSSLTKVINIPLTNNIATLNNDYMHILECKVSFELTSNKCDNSNKVVNIGAIKMPVDGRATIENNFYMKPSYKRPYYIIHNSEGQFLIEILSGSKKDHLQKEVMVEYLKTPKPFNLTEDQIDGLEPLETLEFQDYVCYEIINDIVKLIFENNSDPRLQSHMPINQSIAMPGNTGK